MKKQHDWRNDIMTIWQRAASLGLVALMVLTEVSATSNERIIDPLLRAQPGETSSGFIDHYLIAARSGRVFMRRSFDENLVVGNRWQRLNGITYLEPGESLPKPVLIPGNQVDSLAGITHLHAVDPTGRWLVVQSHCRLDVPSQQDCLPVTLPDGTPSSSLFLIDLPNQQARLITHRHDDPAVPAEWRIGGRGDVRISEDARYIFFAGRGNGLIAGDTELYDSYSPVYRYDVLSRRHRLLSLPRELGFASGSGADIVWISDDGSRAIFYDGSQTIWQFDAHSNTFTVLSDSVSLASTVSASPNGEYLVSCRRLIGSQSNFHVELTRYSVRSRMHLVINPDPGSQEHYIGCDFPSAISNDGDTVISTTSGAMPNGTDSYRVDRLMKWTVSTGASVAISHGAGEIQQAAERDARLAGISADGAKVLYAASWRGGSSPFAQDAPFSLYLRDLETGALKLISKDTFQAGRAGEGYRPQFAPDQQTIYFLSRERMSTAADLNRTGDLYAYALSNDSVKLVSKSERVQPRTPNADALSAKISANGDWVAFESAADDLLVGQTPSAGLRQVYRVSTKTRAVDLVTVSRDGATRGAHGYSQVVDISADGRFVTFTSDALDLNIAGAYRPSNHYSDVFVWDAQSRQTALVSRVRDGAPTGTGAGPSGSTYVDHTASWFLLNASDPRRLMPQLIAAPGTTEALLILPRDASAEPELVNRVYGTSLEADPSPASVVGHTPDLSVVAFRSTSRQLTAVTLPFPVTREQVYLFDRRRQQTLWLTRSATNPERPANGTHYGGVVLSADGRFALFTHTAGDLSKPVETGAETEDCFRYTLATGAIERVATAPNPTRHATICHDLSDDGRYALYTERNAAASGEVKQLWRQDLQTGQRILVNLASDGTELVFNDWRAELSADGQRVSFYSDDVRAFPPDTLLNYSKQLIRDLASGITTPVFDHTTLSLDRFSSRDAGPTATPDLSSVVMAAQVTRGEELLLRSDYTTNLFLSRVDRRSNNPGLSALWGEVGVGGQGLQIVSVPGRSEMLASWYTYLPQGAAGGRTRQQWLLGLGQIRNGVATFELAAPDDGVFVAPGVGDLQSVGQLALRFVSCDEAEATYSLTLAGQKLQGVMPLHRISPDTTCTQFEALGDAALAASPTIADSPWQYGHGGAWHDAATPGQGFLMEVVPATQQVLATWFTFDPTQQDQQGRSKLLWLAAVGDIQGAQAHMRVFETQGGVLRVDTTSLREIGELNIVVQSCNEAIATYRLDWTGASRSGQIPLSRITPSVRCVD